MRRSCILQAEKQSMGGMRIPGWNRLLLAAAAGCATSAYAACNGPQNLAAALSAHPTVDNTVALGSWYANHDQFPCAIEAFGTGLKSNPNSAQLHYLLGLSLVAAKRPADAVPEIERSIRIEPQVLKPHLLLASVYDETGREGDAEHEWRRALAINPKSEQALEALTGMLMGRKDYAGVVQLLENAPRTERLSMALARALGLLNYPDHAESVLREALEQDPGSVPIQRAMLVALVKQRKYEDAIKLARGLVEKHPDDIELSIDYLRVLVLKDHLDEAKLIGPKLLAARPKDPEVLFLNGILERGLGDFAGAKTLLEQVIAIQPDFVNARYELGVTLVSLKEWQEAKEQLERVIAQGGSQPEMHFALAKALRGVGETDRAAEETQKYQQMKKDDEARLEAAEDVAQGDMALEDGKDAEATGHYREALASQPGVANYHYKLSIALNRSGDSDGEREELEKAIALDPNLPAPHNALGYLLSRTGDAEGAVKHFQLAVQAAPGWPEAWINLAAELAVTRHFSDARQAVAKALELDPANAQARELSDQLARDPAAQQNHP